MNASVISINPGKPTPSILLNPPRFKEETRKLTKASTAAKDAVRILLGSRCDRKSSCLLLVSRLFFGVTFIFYGLNHGMTLSAGTIHTPTGLSLVMIVLGALISIGLLERLSALGGTALFTAWLSGSPADSSFTMTVTLLLAVCACLALAGPGKFSIDRIIQRHIGRRSN